jgi:hypothetical protein
MSTFDEWTTSIDAGPMPTGRRLPSVTGPQGVFGVIRNLQTASDDNLALARRNLREISDEDLERLAPRRFRDKAGQEWQVPPGFTNLYDASAIEAFTVRGGNIVPLQRVEQGPSEQTQPIGEMRARRA